KEYREKEEEDNNNNNKEEDDEEYDYFDEKLHALNKQYRPYRDKIAQEEEGEERDEDYDDNFSTTSATSTIMDPKMVRAKMKQSLLKRMKQEKRRIRNKGESALATERQREAVDTIKSSMGSFF